MGLRTLLFAAIFAGSCLGVTMTPIWGVLGYVAHYSIGPERQWWHAPMAGLGLRYSFLLASLTAASITLHRSKLRYGEVLFTKHEKLFLAFVCAVWVAYLLGPETVGRYTRADIDHPSVKFTKIAIFALMMTHVVTTRRNLDLLIWVMILGGLILGLQAWDTPYSSFRKGRLERVGGPDFAEANFFGAYMASLLWLTGVQFLRSGWKGKLICFLCGGFIANAVVLSRSRGAVVGLCAGALMAFVAAPKQYRKFVPIGVILAGIGFFSLTDEQWTNRASSIMASEEERDTSAQSRINLAKAGFRMWIDHPFGVGPGNFYQTIGSYDPQYAGKDAHNTFVRCLTELGIFGLAIFLLTILSGFRLLRQTSQAANELASEDRADMSLLTFGMTCALTTMLASALTVSLTYVEFVWWFLMLPVCLQRAVQNLLADQRAESLPASLAN